MNKYSSSIFDNMHNLFLKPWAYECSRVQDHFIKKKLRLVVYYLFLNGFNVIRMVIVI